jgi:hypothetical protein
MFISIFLIQILQQLIFCNISRNCLLEYRKKIAKFLVMTFTCRSTFLNAVHCTLYSLVNWLTVKANTYSPPLSTGFPLSILC